MKNKFKKNYKFILGTIFGVIISASSVFAASVLTGDKIPYDNTNSKLSSTNVKEAIDEVNTKATKKVEEAKALCPDEKICIATPVLSFSTDSWATIAANVKAGNAGAYQVGDTKEIDMGDLGTHTVRVANTSPCTNGETSETACGFVVEFADILSQSSINSTATNVGGWPASEMRTYVNGTIYDAIPNELQNIIATTTVVSSHGSTSGETNFTSSDKLYLLSTKEVWGKDGTSDIITEDTAEAETRQLDYYKNKGVTTSNYSGAIKQYNGLKSSWWLRSAHSNNTSRFFAVGVYGVRFTINANSTYGVSPAFRIA